MKKKILKKPKKLNTKVIFLISITLIMSITILLIYKKSFSKEKITKAKDFQIEDVNGKVVTLSSFERKSNVVINFWGSWCSGCLEEMPAFSKLENEYNGSNVEFLMINSTNGIIETKESAKSYLSKNNLNFKNLLLDYNGDASYKYNVESIPTTILINKSGYIVKRFDDSISEEELRSSIENLLLSN